MTIFFRGGELQQKGRGIGGFFRGLIQLFKPLIKSAGSSLVKVASSPTTKSIAKSLGEQALNSSMNMAKDVIRGNDMKDSLYREMDNMKRTGTDIIDDIQLKRSRNEKRKKHKKILKLPKGNVSLKTMKKYESRKRNY